MIYKLTARQVREDMPGNGAPRKVRAVFGSIPKCATHNLQVVSVRMLIGYQTLMAAEASLHIVHSCYISVTTPARNRGSQQNLLMSSCLWQVHRGTPENEHRQGNCHAWNPHAQTVRTTRLNSVMGNTVNFFINQF